ncbi:hypothetical protein QTP88_022625 [Uroleucon formosanum]
MTKDITTFCFLYSLMSSNYTVFRKKKKIKNCKITLFFFLIFFGFAELTGFENKSYRYTLSLN